jgi:hypothetical protein
MSRLRDIPIRVEFAPAEECGGTIGAGILAILAEIATKLDTLFSHGESDAIDLRTLPLSAADSRQLEEALGHGETTIMLQADGESTIRETAVAGVWWHKHRDRQGTLLAEYLEIARVPDILPVESYELERAAADMQSRLQHPNH